MRGRAPVTAPRRRATHRNRGTLSGAERARDDSGMPSPTTRLRARLLCCAALSLAGCATAARAPRPTAPQLAITMDDLPVHGTLPPGETRASVAERILAAFRAAGVPEVYGFLNAAHLEREPETAAVLSAW